MGDGRSRGRGGVLTSIEYYVQWRMVALSHPSHCRGLSLAIKPITFSNRPSQGSCRSSSRQLSSELSILNRSEFGVIKRVRVNKKILVGPGLARNLP